MDSPVTSGSRPRTRLSKGRSKKTPVTKKSTSVLSSPITTPVSPEKTTSTSPEEEYQCRTHDDIYTSSPYVYQSSQMPPPGKEVFWDFDTPQGKKLREKLKREASPLPPPLKLDTPRLKMQVCKSRREQNNKVSKEDSDRADEAFNEFMELCKPLNLETSEPDVEDQKKTIEDIENKMSASQLNTTIEYEEPDTKVKEDEIAYEKSESLHDMFDGSGNCLPNDIEESKPETVSVKSSTENPICDMFDDDDDDSLLLMCTQAAEDAVEKQKAILAPVKSNAVIPNAYLNSAPAPNPVVKSVATQDAFGEDDSFDDFMSQINEEEVIGSAIAGNMSPVIVSKNKRRKCFELNLVGQNEAALGSKPPVTTTANFSLSSRDETKPAKTNLNSSFKRFKSSDDGIRSGASGSAVRRIHSSPDIPRHNVVPPERGKVRQASGPAVKTSQSVCTREEIERKRKEAMKKRQQSQTQKNQKFY